MQNFSIDNLIDNLIEVMHQSNPEFKINRIGFANCDIYGDEMRLEQVIINFLTNAIKCVENVDSLEELRGVEGEAASVYFSVFDDLILQQKEYFTFKTRNKRPPLDFVNALLLLFD